MPIAGVVQTVEVTAPLVPVQIESADLGTVIDQRRIQSLPLNRRDFLQLAMLTPGVNPPAEGSELSSRGSFAMHANGGREEYNNFLLDGVDNNDPYVNRYVVQPPVDSIQEFKIATNSYSAEYGRSAAGQVNVITRSGSNRFDLSAYEYFRNEALNARNAFDTERREAAVRAQPVRRELRRAAAAQPHVRVREHRLPPRAESVTRLSTVPTDLQRAGNLSELPVTVYDPFTRQPFPGNVIPANRIDPIARQVIEMFPHANRPRPGRELPLQRAVPRAPEPGDHPRSITACRTRAADGALQPGAGRCVRTVRRGHRDGRGLRQHVQGPGQQRRGAVSARAGRPDAQRHEVRVQQLLEGHPAAERRHERRGAVGGDLAQRARARLRVSHDVGRRVLEGRRHRHAAHPAGVHHLSVRRRPSRSIAGSTCGSSAAGFATSVSTGTSTFSPEGPCPSPACSRVPG